MKKLDLKDFRVVDILILTYCVLMLILNALFGAKLENHIIINIIYWGSIFYTLVCIYLRKIARSPFIKFMLAISPLLPLAGFYEVAGYQIHMFFNGFFDQPILSFENFIFGTHPTIWLQRFNNPLFTEWMMFAYTTYLLLLPITAATLFIKGKQSESEHLVFSLMLTFFICYLGFILLPVEGPRFVLKSQYTVVFHGYLFKALADYIEKNAMLHGGCFPSAHCAAATVMLLLSHKYDRKLFYWIAPIIITLYISTVYGRYHYPLDVIAGIFTGILGIRLSYPLQAWWYRITGETHKKLVPFGQTAIPESVKARLDRE